MIRLLSLHAVHDYLNINILLDDLLQLPLDPVPAVLLSGLPPLQGRHSVLRGGVPLLKTTLQSCTETVLQGSEFEVEVALETGLEGLKVRLEVTQRGSRVVVEVGGLMKGSG